MVKKLEQLTRSKNATAAKYVAESSSIDELLVHCVWRILQRGEQCTFERLVVECYRTFPEQFSLHGFPEYPDSARVNKSWLRCRTDHGWLLGNVKLTFSLAPAGERIARSIEQRMTGKTVLKKTATRDRTREQSILRFVRTQPSFAWYCSSPESYCPTKNDIYILASSTLDTPLRVVKQNLHQLLDAAVRESDSQVQGFIEAVLASIGSGKPSSSGGA